MNDVALKEYLEAKIAALRERIDDQKQAHDRALALATDALREQFSSIWWMIGIVASVIGSVVGSILTLILAKMLAPR